MQKARDKQQHLKSAKHLCEMVALVTRNMMSTSCWDLLNFDNFLATNASFRGCTHSRPTIAREFAEDSTLLSQTLLLWQYKVACGAYCAGQKESTCNHHFKWLVENTKVCISTSAHCGTTSRRKLQSLIRDQDGPWYIQLNSKNI